jgi:hypothetical protein
VHGGLQMKHRILTHVDALRNFAVWLPKRATIGYYSRRLCNVLLHPK